MYFKVLSTICNKKKYFGKRNVNFCKKKLVNKIENLKFGGPKLQKKKIRETKTKS